MAMRIASEVWVAPIFCSMLARWISTVRGPTTAIVEERRPVKLDNLYLIGDKTHDRMHLLPTLVNGRMNHDAARLDEEAARNSKGSRARRGAAQARRRLFTPSRLEVVDLLEQHRMLPAICFIFSRNQCDEAARECVAPHRSAPRTRRATKRSRTPTG